MLKNTFSVLVRHMQNLLLQSRRYFIEPLGGKHLKSMLYSRFLKFINYIKYGNKIEAKLLLQIIQNNTETITGRNIKKMAIESEKSNIKNADYKIFKDLKFCEMSENDEWNVGLINEMTDIKQGKVFLDFSNEESMENDEILFFLALHMQRPKYTLGAAYAALTGLMKSQLTPNQNQKSQLTNN